MFNQSTLGISCLKLSSIVSAINAKTLEVKFSKAVDNTKAVFEVKKDGFKANYSNITWNADKTVATVELSSKITKGEYTVNVTGLVTEKTLTGSVTTQDEAVSDVQILSEVAPMSNETTAALGYKVVNQYGEDITKLTNLDFSAAGATIALDGKGGLTLTNANKFKEGDKVVVTLIHAPSAKSVTKTVTISSAAKVSDVTVGTLYNKDGKTINEETDLSKDLFYLPVNVTDQYGTAVTDVKKLNGEKAEVIVTNTNPTVVTTGNFEVIKINDKDTVVLPVKGDKDNKAAVGEAAVTVIAKANGKNSQGLVKVSESTRSDIVNLQASPNMVVAGEDVYLPISVLDKEGKAITDVKAVNKGVRVTSNNGTIVEKDGVLFVKVSEKIVMEGTPVTVVVQSSTNKVATQTFIPKAAATPKVVTGLTLSSQSLRPGASAEVTYDKLKIEDQYGRVMSKETLANALDAGYSIQASAGSNKNITIVGSQIKSKTDVVKVSAAAGVKAKTSENVTFTLVAPKTGENLASAFDAKFTIVPDSEFASYEVADLGTIYLDKDGKIAKDYNQKLVVKAVSKDGGKVTLDNSTDYTVKSVVITGLTDGEIDGTDASAVKYASGATTATAKVTVTINATGQEITKDVNFSNVAPKAEKVTFVENNKGANYIAGDKEVKTITEKTFDKSAAFTIDELEDLADVVVTDQYGVSVKLDETNETVSFASETPVTATLTFSKVSGDVTFASNGTKTAVVNEISAGAIFNSKLDIANATSTLKVTSKQAYSKAVVDADAKALTEAKTAAKTKIETAELSVTASKTAADNIVKTAETAKVDADKGTDETAKVDAQKAVDTAKELQTKVVAEVAKVTSAKDVYAIQTTVADVEAQGKIAEDAAKAAAVLVK